MKKYLYKILHKLGIRFCQCGKCVWFSKQTLRWSDGVDYNEDGSPYFCGYTAPACQNCIAYSQEEIW